MAGLGGEGFVQVCGVGGEVEPAANEQQGGRGVQGAALLQRREGGGVAVRGEVEGGCVHGAQEALHGGGGEAWRLAQELTAAVLEDGVAVLG